MRFFKDISKKSICLILFAGILLAFGLYNVHAHSSITEGGILGLSLFFDHVLHVSPAVSATVLNILCYLLGIRVLGKKFLVYSAVATASFSLSYAVFEMFPPIFPAIAEYPLIAAIVGALFVGTGCGICVRVGGAPSGDDALAMALSHVTHLSVTWIYLISDLTVLSLSLLYIPLSKILYSLLTVILSGQLIGFIARVPLPEPRKEKSQNEAL